MLPGSPGQDLSEGKDSADTKCPSLHGAKAMVQIKSSLSFKFTDWFKKFK